MIIIIECQKTLSIKDMEREKRKKGKSLSSIFSLGIETFLFLDYNIRMTTSRNGANWEKREEDH